eukprot:PhM_4_TR3007/c1_g1_i6/m.37676
MIRGNRCGNLPSSDLLDIDTSDLPLHVKDVTPLSLQALADLPCCAPDVDDRWRRVHGWLIGDHPSDVSRGRGTEARITRHELDLLLELKHIERTTREAVLSTCDVFPVPEPAKLRRRLIKHTKWLNARFGKDTLLKIKLSRTADLGFSVLDGDFCVTLDFAAWYDQFELAEQARQYHCFLFEGEWFRLRRLPMGQRQAVDVAHTATCRLLAFPMPPSVSVSAYVDNIRFLS